MPFNKQKKMKIQLFAKQTKTLPSSILAKVALALLPLVPQLPTVAYMP